MAAEGKSKNKIGTVEQVSFSVDAGIINRLGLELFQRAESAVAELIKNAYDADANNVEVTFAEVKETGGTLIIEDDGEGMTKNQLINGFMRIASTEKLHNPISTLGRKKAGKKGIGRFATIFLGTKITIVTNNAEDKVARKLEINWNSYKIDTEITKVENKLEVIEKTKAKGTTITIENLRESWSEKDIKRVYRYIADLLQPTVYKINKKKKAKNKLIEVEDKNTFEVRFFEKENTTRNAIADIDIMMFDRALAKITAYIDEDGYGFCSIESKKFGLSGKELHKISDTDIDREKHMPFEALKGTSIILIAYYFIDQRLDYYQDGFTSPELKTIMDYLKSNGNLKLYRNRFRLPIYGGNNDWLGINKNSRKFEGIPFNIKNFVGYVQLTEEKDIVFDETTGREGLIEKDAFNALTRFLQSSMLKAFGYFAIALKDSPEFKKANNTVGDKPANPTDLENSTKKIEEDVDTLTDEQKSKEEKAKAEKNLKKDLSKLKKQAKALSNEAEMLRILAGVGLTIGEFTHEIKQFSPSFSGFIDWLISQKLNEEVIEKLSVMQTTFASFQTYTAYFDKTISQNILRELEPIDLKDAVSGFEKIVEPDLIRRGIILKTNQIGNNVIAAPMHRAEWNAIFQNLYSNAKKAIHRAGIKRGEIMIEYFKEKKSVYLHFMDNGDGISYSKQILTYIFL